MLTENEGRISYEDLEGMGVFKPGDLAEGGFKRWLQEHEDVYKRQPLYICGQIAIAEDEDYAMERLSEFEQRRAELQASSAKREPSIRVAYDSFRKAAL